MLDFGNSEVYFWILPWLLTYVFQKVACKHITKSIKFFKSISMWNMSHTDTRLVSHRLLVILKHLSSLLVIADLLHALSLQVPRSDQLKVPAVVEQRARQERVCRGLVEKHWGRELEDKTWFTHSSRFLNNPHVWCSQLTHRSCCWFWWIVLTPGGTQASSGQHRVLLIPPFYLLHTLSTRHTSCLQIQRGDVWKLTKLQTGINKK